MATLAALGGGGGGRWKGKGMEGKEKEKKRKEGGGIEKTECKKDHCLKLMLLLGNPQPLSLGLHFLNQPTSKAVSAFPLVLIY